MKRLLATDLDGTILAHKGAFHRKDIEVLQQLGEEGFVRVVATGRTLQSALSVLERDFPIDYLVFSSGAGIYCWKEQKLLITKHLGYEKTKELVAVFQQHHVEYTLHHPIPENHLFFHPEGDDPHPDFERYLEFNQAHAEVINGNVPQLDYTQTLAFMPDVEMFKAIEQKLTGVKVVRATSPIDGVSIWMECFHNEVSKANGILEVCEMEGVEQANVSVVGNDYNDLDMLGAFKNAYVVDNAPDELKQQFTNLCAVTEAPLADWRKRFIL
ncbi:HAD family phosphatase [Carboxylicivirga mesophila]|uniref:HAD family phosphatase n=1 Tax=Carboxylicivirga mesophila TaxID=1166478 RepID=A0ABS5K774_9BACT|nr:HAD family hydrolase [Carboxylicivirga mesophila]MBS2210361.1 HAD family phosphatase [Carboxylicivirga mesophila]